MTKIFKVTLFIITELLKFTGAIYIFKLTYAKYNNEFVFQIGTILVVFTLFKLIKTYLDFTEEDDNEQNNA